MSQEQERLYPLLPAVYRVRDAAEGEPLRALLALVEEELRALEGDVDELYNNWFIETCDEWVVPYIGDLLGVRGLRTPGAGAFSMRSYVGHTLAYRRRKGTAAVLEQLARDLTGWPARAVEFFQLLGTTQHLNHLRPENVRTPDLRNVEAVGRLSGPFHQIPHTAEVRRIEPGRGRYNILNVGLFLWRLGAYAMRPAAASPGPAGCYFAHPLRLDAPLFNRPQTESAVDQLAEEPNVPGPLRPAALFADLSAYKTANAPLAADRRAPQSIYYGADRAVSVFRDGALVPPMAIVCADLSRWDRPRAGTVALDVSLGRVAFPAGEEPGQVQVAYSYGFSGDTGGGPYERRPAVPASPDAPDTVLHPDVWGPPLRVGAAAAFPTLTAALAAWDPVAQPRVVVQIEDNRTYVESPEVPLAGEEIVIQAARGFRPVLVGDLTLTGGTGQERVTLNGLLVAGTIRVAGTPGQLSMAHCTLTPDRPSIIAQPPNDRLTVRIDSSITGPLYLPAAAAGLEARDSILGQPGRHTPGLLGAEVDPFPAPFPAAEPALQVTFGGDGPYPVALAGQPPDLEGARTRLEAALRQVPAGPAAANARVLRIGTRLLVLPGAPVSVRVERSGADPTAEALGLTPAQARAVPVLVSGGLDPFPTLTAANPRLQVSGGGEVPGGVALNPAPTTLITARNRLQGVLPQTLVAAAGGRLYLVPLNGESPLRLSPDPADRTTVTELNLETDQPVIAAGDGADAPGPVTTLERCTVFGPVYVRELVLASDVVFTGAVRAERRQAGCVRFCYVPEGSRTPRRYRCQPDLALDDAKSQGVKDVVSQARIRTRLQPVFTSQRYGDPGYAQLGVAAPDELRTGASDEGEMGAFNRLGQTQRAANLRAALDEYLRFGMEAGVFYVT